MASSDTWIKEYNEAARIADDINGMISERISLPASGPETQRHASAIRRKITILGTRLDGLQSLLSRPTGKPLYVILILNRGAYMSEPVLDWYFDYMSTGIFIIYDTYMSTCKLEYVSC